MSDVMIYSDCEDGNCGHKPFDIKCGYGGGLMHGGDGVGALCFYWGRDGGGYGSGDGNLADPGGYGDGMDGDGSGGNDF